MRIIITIGDIVAGIAVAGLIIGFILYLLYEFYQHILKPMFCHKVYAEVYTDAPQLLLDRKWGIKYKKHWWNNWQNYKEEGRKYDHDYLRYEAELIANKLRKGEITV